MTSAEDGGGQSDAALAGGASARTRQQCSLLGSADVCRPRPSSSSGQPSFIECRSFIYNVETTYLWSCREQEMKECRKMFLIDLLVNGDCSGIIIINNMITTIVMHYYG